MVKKNKQKNKSRLVGEYAGNILISDQLGEVALLMVVGNYCSRSPSSVTPHMPNKYTVNVKMSMCTFLVVKKQKKRKGKKKTTRTELFIILSWASVMTTYQRHVSKMATCAWDSQTVNKDHFDLRFFLHL